MLIYYTLPVNVLNMPKESKKIERLALLMVLLLHSIRVIYRHTFKKCSVYSG